MRHPEWVGGNECVPLPRWELPNFCGCSLSAALINVISASNLQVLVLFYRSELPRLWLQTNWLPCTHMNVLHKHACSFLSMSAVTVTRYGYSVAVELNLLGELLNYRPWCPVGLWTLPEPVLSQNIWPQTLPPMKNLLQIGTVGKHNLRDTSKAVAWMD